MIVSPDIRKHRITRHNQTGVALIEVMVSLLIFSLGVLGMVAMQGKSISYAIDAEDRSRAALLANEIVAAMWLEGTDSPAIKTNWIARVKDPAISGLPNADDPTVVTDADTKVTTVTITWRASSKASSEKNTYFTQLVLP